MAAGIKALVCERCGANMTETLVCQYCGTVHVADSAVSIKATDEKIEQKSSGPSPVKDIMEAGLGDRVKWNNTYGIVVSRMDQGKHIEIELDHGGRVTFEDGKPKYVSENTPSELSSSVLWPPPRTVKE
jgi:hypothetical protein